MDGDLNDVRAQAVEIFVERVTERFDAGDPNLAEALANTTVPLTLADDQYTRGGGFDFETMAQLYVFKSIREFSDNYLQGHLKRYPHLREWFNLDRVPTQQSFSHTWNNRFTPDARHALECAAIAIASTAVERDVIKAELAPEDPEDDELEEEGKPKREYQRERTQQSVRFARKHAHPEFHTSRAENKTYSDNAVFDMLSRMCATRGSAHSEGEYGWITEDEFTADPSTILRAMKKVTGTDSKQLTLQESLEPSEITDSPAVRDAILEPFENAVDNIIYSIEGETPFDERFNIAAIDITYAPISISPWEDREEDIPNPNFPAMASGYKKESEDDPRYPRGYKFATITLVGQNVPIVLGVEPVRNNSMWQDDDAPSDSYGELVSRLLDRAEQFVDLDMVLFDRGFYSEATLTEIDQRGLTYLAPMPRYQPEKDAIENVEEHPTADMAIRRGCPLTYEGHTHENQQLFVPSSEKTGSYAVFVTNMDRVETDHIRHVVNIYSRRWDIENQYKSIKEFMPRTSSMDFRVRFLVFVFATLMYNLWRLTDYLIKLSLDIPLRDEPVLGARTFVRAVGNFLRETD
jgi:hypothetical protein